MPNRPAKKMGVTTVHQILTNPYYNGNVTYQGATCVGNHERLVEAEHWYTAIQIPKRTRDALSSFRSCS